MHDMMITPAPRPPQFDLAARAVCVSLCGMSLCFSVFYSLYFRPLMRVVYPRFFLTCTR